MIDLTSILAGAITVFVVASIYMLLLTEIRGPQ
jgi:hypothetical protein